MTPHEALQTLMDERGGYVAPADVVEAARPEESPLHSLFTWDDTKAAAAHRLWQARQVIRSYKIRVEVVNGSAVKVPALLRDPQQAPREQGYVSTLVVRTKEADSREIMASEVKRLLAHVERMRALAAVLGVLDSLTGIQSSVEELLGELHRAA